MNTKECRKCNIVKPLSDFFSEKRSADGRRYSCKACDHARRVKRLTGLSVEQLAEKKSARAKHAQAEREYSHERRTKYRAKALVYLAKQRAAKKGVPFDLDGSVDAIQRQIEGGVCSLTGLPFRLDESRSFDSPSLDRIKPELGYVPGNVRVVLYGMNCALGTWGEENLRVMLEAWQRRFAVAKIDDFI